MSNPAGVKLDAAYIELGRQLLTRIDGIDQDLAAAVIGGSVHLTVTSHVEACRKVIATCEAALRDAEECLPRAEILADGMRQLCMDNIRSAITAAHAALATLEARP